MHVRTTCDKGKNSSWQWPTATDLGQEETCSKGAATSASQNLKSRRDDQCGERTASTTAESVKHRRLFRGPHPVAMIIGSAVSAQLQQLQQQQQSSSPHAARAINGKVGLTELAIDMIRSWCWWRIWFYSRVIKPIIWWIYDWFIDWLVTDRLKMLLRLLLQFTISVLIVRWSKEITEE